VAMITSAGSRLKKVTWGSESSHGAQKDLLPMPRWYIKNKTKV